MWFEENKELEEVKVDNQWLEMVKNEGIEYYIEERVKMIEMLIEDEKLFQAEKIVNEMESMLSEDEFSQMKDIEWYKDLVHRVGRCRDLLHAIHGDDENWKLLRESDESKTLYREEDDGTITFRVEGILQVPLFKIAPVIYEVDLYHLWFPMLKQAQTLLIQSRFHKVAQVELNMLWPVDNRDVCIDAYGIDVLEENAVLIVLESIDDHPHVEIPAPAKKTVRCLLRIGGFEIRVISEEETQIVALFNVDPILDLIPDYFINWACGKVVHWFLYYIGEAAKYDPEDQENEYVQAIHNNPEVYDHIADILAQALVSIEQSQSQSQAEVEAEAEQ